VIRTAAPVLDILPPRLYERSLHEAQTSYPCLGVSFTGRL